MAGKGPALGAMDGIRRDIKAAAAEGGVYDPRGIGSGWSHNFLNQKPWHPLNFRNQARVFEAEAEHAANEKRKADTKAEFDAEQDYLQTLSMLSAEEQDKYRARQSVSWLYMRPPGYDAALDRAEQAQRDAGGDPSAAQVPPPAPAAPAAPQQPAQQPRLGQAAAAGGGFVTKMIGAFKAGQDQDRLEIKHAPGGRSPPRGATSLDAPNQQFVIAELASDEEEEALRLASIPESERRAAARESARRARRHHEATEELRLQQAKAFLRAAGLSLPDDEPGSCSSGSSDSDSSGARRRRRSKDTHRKRRHGKHHGKKKRKKGRH